MLLSLERIGTSTAEGFFQRDNPGIILGQHSSDIHSEENLLPMFVRELFPQPRYATSGYFQRRSSCVTEMKVYRERCIKNDIRCTFEDIDSKYNVLEQLRHHLLWKRRCESPRWNSLHVFQEMLILKEGVTAKAVVEGSEKRELSKCWTNHIKWYTIEDSSPRTNKNDDESFSINAK